MKKLLLVLLCSTFLSANSHTIHVAVSNALREPEHRVFFSGNMKDWKIIEPESESFMNKYAIASIIILGVVGLVSGYLWARWYADKLPKV